MSALFLYVNSLVAYERDWNIYLLSNFPISSEKHGRHITVTSHERRGVSNDRQFDCLFSDRSGLQQRKYQISVLLALFNRNPPMTSVFP